MNDAIKDMQRLHSENPMPCQHENAVCTWYGASVQYQCPDCDAGVMTFSHMTGERIP